MVKQAVDCISPHKIGKKQVEMPVVSARKEKESIFSL